MFIHSLHSACFQNLDCATFGTWKMILKTTMTQLELPQILSTKQMTSLMLLTWSVMKTRWRKRSIFWERSSQCFWSSSYSSTISSITFLMMKPLKIYPKKRCSSDDFYCILPILCHKIFTTSHCWRRASPKNGSTHRRYGHSEPEYF